ncbi:MAG: hypothetical protein NTZ60_08900 [Campylobacterales bacterium]|nr:hypothetical protein [Campylobacterales bacterium]
MKNLTALTFLTFALLSLSSCSSSPTVNPSQNKALNSVSTSNQATHIKGTMQNSLDTWLEKKWTPTVEKNETIKVKNEDKGRDFKIQEYVEKIEVYKKENNSSVEESHIQKINTLPVIGK